MARRHGFFLVDLTLAIVMLPAAAFAQIVEEGRRPRIIGVAISVGDRWTK